MSEENHAGMHRRRRSRAEIEETMRAFAASGLGQSEFCRKHGFPLSTLARYLPLSALGGQQPPAAQPVNPSGVIEVEVRPSAEMEQRGSRANLKGCRNAGQRIERAKD